MIRCVVIDDEPLARECIADYITKVDFLTLVDTIANPTELETVEGKETIDLLFLDVQMPIMSGIDYLKYTRSRPMVILTTAYPDYALESYELDALDYMVKPITFGRFYKAVTKANEYHRLQRKNGATETPPSAVDYFFVKCEHSYEKIHYNDIQYIEALENYVVIYTKDMKFMTLMPMKRMEELLDEHQFMRVHKSYIVNIDKILSFEKNRLKLLSKTIPVSRGHKSAVFEKVVNAKLWKK